MSPKRMIHYKWWLFHTYTTHLFIGGCYASSFQLEMECLSLLRCICGPELINGAELFLQQSVCREHSDQGGRNTLCQRQNAWCFPAAFPKRIHQKDQFSLLSILWINFGVDGLRRIHQKQIEVSINYKMLVFHSPPPSSTGHTPASYHQTQFFRPGGFTQDLHIARPQETE